MGAYNLDPFFFYLDWSLDLVTPNSECVRKDGACVTEDFPFSPDEFVRLPLVSTSSQKPDGIIDQNAQLVFTDESNPINDIHGSGIPDNTYILVAQYYQPEKPSN